MADASGYLDKQQFKYFNQCYRLVPLHNMVEDCSRRAARGNFRGEIAMSDEREEDEGSRGFRVQDRRRFTDEGNPREETDEVREYAEKRAPEGSPDPAGSGHEFAQEFARKGADEAAGGAGTEELPPINFSTFIISLSTQALMLLGEINDPETGSAQKDVAVAKQTIDIIGMLDEKCRGNLDEHEERLVKEVLYNLRMRYVEAVRQR